MSASAYIEQLIRESTAGLEALLSRALAAGEVEKGALAAAVQSQVEIEHQHDFKRTPKACEEFLAAVKVSSDQDLLIVATKILRSVRFAAYTHLVGKDAVYVDQPFKVDF